MSGKGFISLESNRKCKECGKVTECRPYGEGGKQVCLTCAKKDITTMEKMASKYLFRE